jgi:uncharacterized membrane protein YkvA (DUF1232 family)
MLWRTILGITVALLVAWAVLVLFLVLARPKGSLVQEAVRLLPDTLRLLRRLAMDRSLPRGVRLRLWLLFGYLAMPVDIIPDFIPVIGYADDAIIVCWVLRSVVRRAGAEAVRRNWPGTEDGLAALWRVAGLPNASGPTSEVPNSSMDE